MHDQMCIRNTRMNFFNALDCQNISSGLLGELICTMACTNRNCQCITLSCLYKVRCLLNISQQLLSCHFSIGAMTIFFITLHGFKRAQYTKLCLNSNSNRVRELHHLFRNINVIFITRNCFTIAL